MTDLELRIGEGMDEHVVVAHARPITGQRGERLGAVLALHDVTGRRRIEDEFRYRALHDALTGLPNRDLFLDRVEQGVARLARTGGACAVLFLDLDNFKYVNDTLGHLTGDAVLLKVSERLQSCLRPSDTAARLGGDEFAVLCEGLADATLAREIADRILAALAPPLEVDGQRISVAASIGITLADGDERDALDLLRDADAAMFLAKDLGRGRHEMFDAALRQNLLSRLDTETGIRRALDDDAFELHYQPVVDLATGTAVGAEALLRWRRADATLISPASFIPIAEQSDLITRLGDWVLRRACRDLAAWRERGLVDDAFTISVNVSVRDLWSVDLVQRVRSILETSGVPPDRLCLELTETALMRDAAAANRIVAQLRATGTGVAVDDFGTGYSSLSYLRRLPLDVLKIDRSFVRGLPADSGDVAVVDTIVSLSSQLGLVSLAEGIETPEQLEVLRRIGCRRGQGFLFSAAVEPDRLPGVLLDLANGQLAG